MREAHVLTAFPAGFLLLLASISASFTYLLKEASDFYTTGIKTKLPAGKLSFYQFKQRRYCNILIKNDIRRQFANLQFGFYF